MEICINNTSRMSRLFAVIGGLLFAGSLLFFVASFGWRFGGGGTWSWTEGARPALVGVLMFLANVAVTMMRARRFTATQGSLLAGLVFLAAMYLFGIPFYRNLAVDWYYWWWVIHLWVEGAWELVTAALVAFMIIQLTGIERRVIEKRLYVELGLFLFTGIAGTGHHYYWVAAPHYWLWIGAIFSSLEPLPVLLMLVDTWRHMHESRRPLRPRLTWVFLFGMAVLHFVGAGAFGMAHTLPQVNYYTHGSQVTVSHGHLAFFGAYVLLNLTFMYFALPRLKKLPGAAYEERAGHWGFWLMSSGVVGMSLAFAVGGVLQTYLERVAGQPYMIAAQPIRLWILVAFVHGLIALAGAILTVVHLLRLRAPEPPQAEKRAATAAVPA